MRKRLVRTRAVAVAAALVAGVGVASGPAPAVADVANPGAISITATSGSGNLGATTFTVDLAQPIRVDGTIDAAGAISVPSGGVHFPTTQQTSSGVTVTVSITNDSPATGTLDTTTGAATVTMPLTIRIAGIPFAGGCHVGPFTVPLTTGTSGALTGSPYDQATGTLRLVAADVAVPNSSGCGAGQSSIDSSIAGTGNYDIAFAVTPILRAGTGNITPAQAVTPQTGPAPLATTLDASASTVATGTITGYDWDFGDGTTATGATTTKSFTNAGTYVVQLTVISNAGQTETTTRLVKIDPLVAPANFRLTGRGGGGVAWDYAYADFAWDPVPGADNYEVERVFIAGCIANGNRGPVLLSGSATTWRDSGEVFSNPSMCRGSQYKWHIRTVNNGARSDWSPWVEPGPL